MSNLKIKIRNRCLSRKSNTRCTHYYSFYWQGHSKILSPTHVWANL